MKRFVLKNFILFFIVLVFASGAYAKNANISYKNIKNNSKIYLCEKTSTWSTSKKCNETKIFVKKVSDENLKFSAFYSPEGDLIFTTETQYEFIHEGKLIGYSNDDLKFYQYVMDENGIIQQNELTAEEVESLFKTAEVIKISEFSNSTNSLKIKKGCRNLKIILVNDTDRDFSDYSFTTHNAKLKKYNLSGFLTVTKQGMIQFSRFGDNTKDSPWYVLLVR